jgi:hypothetical protein
MDNCGLAVGDHVWSRCHSHRFASLAHRPDRLLRIKAACMGRSYERVHAWEKPLCDTYVHFDEVRTSTLMYVQDNCKEDPKRKFETRSSPSTTSTSRSTTRLGRRPAAAPPGTHHLENNRGDSDAPSRSSNGATALQSMSPMG